MKYLHINMPVRLIRTLTCKNIYDLIKTGFGESLVYVKLSIINILFNCSTSKKSS